MSPTPVLGNLLVLRAWLARGECRGSAQTAGVLAPGFSLGGAFSLRGFYPGVTRPCLCSCFLPPVLKEKLSLGSRRRAGSSCQSCTAAGLSHGSLNPGVTPCRPHSCGAGAAGPTVTPEQHRVGPQLPPSPSAEACGGLQAGMWVPREHLWLDQGLPRAEPRGPRHWGSAFCLQEDRTPPSEPTRVIAPV